MVIILFLCLFGGVGAVLASSFATEQNTKQQEEDACALGMDNQQIITDEHTAAETVGCMDDMKTNVID
ncbi:hypothetical protein [Neobacillus niacini]|uniref:hypothetical protein n=1 Tax=Neobacillus niacini TaxID=86668 RepID=UPI0005EEAC9C|nr:hypothetical protein [Neobacillus niacini]